ncbi:MAG TPA: rRNA maturation RNase YbeY [Bacillota bacterium]|nr:rRNA maturation RNase YbeY [Bacillota bacterium]
MTAELRAKIRAAVRTALKYEGFEEPAEVSIVLTDNEGIRELNKLYRGKDAPTDVLSFPLYGPDEDIEITEGERAELGDIVISLERAATQAEEIGNTFEREVMFLCVHSVLHLLGWDHETSKEDERAMIEEQKAIMAILDSKMQKGQIS